MIINPIKTILKMKKLILLLILIATMSVVNHSAYATLKRLNNNPGVVADYTNIDDALNGQSTWDTLYVEPSATTYLITQTFSFGENPDLSDFVSGYLEAWGKVIIGNGYDFDNGNLNYTPPPLQNIKLPSKIGAALDFASLGLPGQNSQYLRISNMCTCIGLTFVNEVRQMDLITPFNFHSIYDINLISCKFEMGINFRISSQKLLSVNDIKIRKCFCEGIYFFNGMSKGTLEIDNFIIENNIIRGTANSIILVDDSMDVNGLIVRNNVFTKAFYCKSAYCANNIFLDTDTAHYFFKDNNLKNNIFVAPSFSITNTANAVNNQFNIDPNLLFIPLNIFGGPDAEYYLASGSPAIGAGVPNGSIPVDCGAFGGPDPYRLSGIPPFPTIYSLSTPTVIPAGTNMNLTISTRSNQ